MGGETEGDQKKKGRPGGGRSKRRDFGLKRLTTVKVRQKHKFHRGAKNGGERRAAKEVGKDLRDLVKMIHLRGEQSPNSGPLS